MSGEQRLLMAFEICMFASELAMARLRSEHPDWPEKQIAIELLRLAFLPDRRPASLR
jgi:hypothetical protein